MGTNNEDRGPTSIFSGAMAAVTTRNVKSMRFLAASTFTSLTFMYDAADPNQVNPNVPTYPALAEINDVKSFRLLTGAIEVNFYGV